TKPQIVVASKKGTSLTQETKPEIVITSQKGTSLTQESKPEIVIASGKGTSLTQEAKPEIVIASEKGASLTQEKPIYPEWKLLALTAEKPVLEFPTTKIPEQAPTLESKPELVLKTKKGESLIQDTKPQIFVEKQDLKSKQEQVDKEVGKALEKLEKSITKQGQEKSNLDNRVLPKTSAQSSENKNLPLGLGILTLMVAYLTKRSIRK
ncbi:MAG: hypothetical protein Q3988_01790, partial [Gemella sp.]|nr:hypothetical protein [Gemella sp.]